MNEQINLITGLLSINMLAMDTAQGMEWMRARRAGSGWGAGSGDINPSTAPPSYGVIGS
jgi:hypothetical protein